MMDYFRLAMNYAKRDEDGVVSKKSNSAFLEKRRQRFFRRLNAAAEQFDGATLKNGGIMTIETLGHAGGSMIPAITFYEVMPRSSREKVPLASVFVESMDDGEDGKILCQAICVWTDPEIRLSSTSPDKLMRALAKQFGSLLKWSADE